MTEETQPRTRLQQLVDKIEQSPNADLTEAEQLLDQQAGFYTELTEATTPAEARQVLIATNQYMAEEKLDLRENFVLPVLAAVLRQSQKYATAAQTPTAGLPDVIEKMGSVFGVTPALFKDAPVQTHAEIMERDFETDKLSAELKTFGFKVENGKIGDWNAPAKPQPSATKPPPRIG